MTCTCKEHCSNRCAPECCGVNAAWCPCACHALMYALRGSSAPEVALAPWARNRARAKYLTDSSSPKLTTEDTCRLEAMRRKFPGKEMRQIDGMWMTLHAALVATGAGRSPLMDFALIQNAAHTRQSLFRECLRQSDPRTRQHWSEYTFAIECYVLARRGDATPS